MSPQNVLRYAKSALLIMSAQKYSRELAHAPRILVAGDSTAYGTGASQSIDSIAGRLGEDFLSYEIENIAKNGLTLAGLHEKLKTLPPSDPYELMLIQIGGNDILQKTDPKLIEAALAEIIVLAKLRSKHVVVMSSGNVGGAPAFAPYGSPLSLAYEAQTRTVRDIFIRVAQAEGALYIDLFREPEDDVFIKEPKRYMAFDGLHPSSEGYAVWYNELYPSLASLLKS